MRTIIQLNDLPDEGLEFEYDRKSGELNRILQDIIEDQDYKFSGHLTSLGKYFEITGQFTAQKADVCSKCGQDMLYTIKNTIHELLMEGKEDPRNSHYAKTNHYSDMTFDGPSITFYENPAFDLGEFLHEILAFSIPFCPTCSKCEKCEDSIVSYDEEFPKGSNSPFISLKGIKIN